MMYDKLDWIESEGGPLMLAPRSALVDWHGILSTAGSKTDYDRACDIEDEIGVISIMGKAAIVLGDMPNRTALLCLGKEIIVLRWQWAPSEEALLSAVFAATGFRSLQFSRNCSILAWAEDYWLFDSGVPGDEVSEHLHVRMEAENYLIETAYLKQNRDVCAVIHRLRKEAIAVGT
jgi:hypothetical protein